MGAKGTADGGVTDLRSCAAVERACTHRASIFTRLLVAPLALALALAADRGAAGEAPKAAEAPPPSCAPSAAETPAEVRVVSAIDGRHLTLADGRTVQLTGLVLPSNGASRARAALEDLAAGRPVRLAHEGNPDRYGRIPAVVLVERGGAWQGAQTALLRMGEALRAPVGVPGPCAAEWRDAERFARERKLGLWADPYYLVKKSGDVQALIAERGRFVIVEGRVVSVRESGGMIYLNFGRRGTGALTVGVLKRNEGKFLTAGVALKPMRGRVLRVRGWLEVRTGPWIEAAGPEQIDIDRE